MMLHLTALALALGGGAPPVRPAFEFRDWHVSDRYRPDDSRISHCRPIPTGNACVFTDNRIGGVAARHVGGVFDSNGLFALEARFARSESDTVEAALRNRYGKPCEQRIERRSNMLGETAENRIRVWCFAEGKATFQTIADTMATEAMFLFKSYDAARRSSVVDF